MSASEPGVVTGVVEDADGNPVEGVTCILKRQSDNKVFETTTDVSGVYRFENLPQGEYHGMVRWEDGQGNLYNSRNQPYIQVEGVAIPDSVVTRYTFEDDSDTTTAIDAVGSNDATLNGGSFSTDSAVGDFAWSQDGTGDYAVSNSTVDLSASGSTVGASVGARLKPSKTGSFQVAVYWGGGSGSRTYLALGISDSDEWRASIFSGEGTFESVRGGSVSTTAYKEVFVASDNTDLWVIEDGSEVARITISNGADLTALGAQNLGLSRNADLDNQYYGGLTDNPSYIDKAIEASQSDGAV